LGKIFELFLNYGIRGLFKTVIVIFQYYEKKLIAGTFEDLMEFLSEMPKQEIFQTPDYYLYCKLKKNGESFNVIKKKVKSHRACYFVYTFKEQCKRISIPQKFVDLLENKYKVVSAKVSKSS
jgi:hypothetical protein